MMAALKMYVVFTLVYSGKWLGVSNLSRVWARLLMSNMCLDALFWSPASSMSIISR